MGFDGLIKEFKYRNIAFTAILMLLGIYFYQYALPDWYFYVALLAYFILMFIAKIDSRLPIAGALLLLIMTPFFLIRNLENYANYLATMAYFLLVIGVIKQFVEYLRENKEN